MSGIMVRKRRLNDGKPVFEELQIEKIHKVITWAAEGLKNVSVSQVEMESQIDLFDGITTEQIHETLIKTATNLILEDAEYQYLAARLYIFHLRKKVYGSFTPPKVIDFVNKMIDEGLYTKELSSKYTQKEFKEMEKIIDHERDFEFTHLGISKFAEKYLIKNRVNGKIYETPQFSYLFIAATIFMNEPKNIRMKLIKEFYDSSSKHILSLPTPIVAGVRTPTKQFSSCVLIETADTRKSINGGASSIVEYVSLRAGIGLSVGANRGEGMPIKGGEARHTGLIPFLKYFQAALSSCSQGGIRKGSATVYWPFWHQEFENLIVLKNNQGTEESRVRHMDYGVQFSRLFFKRLMKNENITLFSPYETPGLYDAFFQDEDKFEELYEMYEKKEGILKKSIPAFNMAAKFLIERANTGRIYYFAADHVNSHSSFLQELAPVKMSNLCAEITLPTKPFENLDSTDGEVALCTLMAINVGKIDTNNYEEYKKNLSIAVRALDNLLDYQEYPIEVAGYHAVRRRSLGIGITNFANFLAKNGAKYSDGSGNEITHKLFEKFQYALIESSMELAEERGKCEYFNQTKYSKGILPIDTYRKTVDKICDTPLELDWEKLRKSVLKHGMRHSTLSALMPCETSSQVLNATNGFEPPKKLITIKSTVESSSYHVVDDYEELKNNYETIFAMGSNIGYLNLASIAQKFVDQSISSNTYYNPYQYPNSKIPLSVLMQDFIHSWNMGLKTLYYQVTQETEEDSNTDLVEEDCDSCKL